MTYRRLPTLGCEENYTVYVTKDGDVFSFGYSFHCAHGHGEKQVFPPKKISTLTNIQSVVCSGEYSTCLDYDGNVYSFGVGFDTKSAHIPQKITLPPCIQISCGSMFVLCLTEDRKVYSFGSNPHGELGVGNNNRYDSPQLISSLKDVEFIECGTFHAFCKTLNNEIYSWGHNWYGQLGFGNTDNQNTPILCSSLSNENVIDIKCGGGHTIILTSNGDVLSCGYNSENQLGIETNGRNVLSFQQISNLSEIITIECRASHSMYRC